MANLAGQSIKGYELLERVGAGGFGAVYRSYQSTIGREVAVKTILPGYANKPSFIRLTLLDAHSGEPIRSFSGSTSALVTSDLSADGTILVAGTSDGTVHVWNTETGEEIRQLSEGGDRYKRSADGEFYVAVSPDNQLVATKARGRIQVWDLESGQQLYRFEHEVDWSPLQFADGGRLLMTSILPALHLWDLATGQEVTPNISTDQFLFFHQSIGLGGGEKWLSPDGRYFAQGLVGLRGQDVLLWELDSGTLLHQLTGHHDSAIPVDYTGDGRLLVTRGGDGTARVWDVTTGQEMLVLAAHSDAILGADISADDRYLVTASLDQTVRIWDLQAQLRAAKNQLKGVRDAIYFSPDGQAALSSTVDRDTAMLVDAASFELLHTLDFRLDAAGPAFASDGQAVVGVTDAGTIIVHDVASGDIVGEHTNPNGTYEYAAFVPNSRLVFAGGDDGAYLLNAQTGEQTRFFATPGAGLFGANSGYVTVSPDGRYGALHMWTPDTMNVVYLWELQSGELVFQSTPRPDDVVSAFAFSDDSRYFAWGGSSNNAYLLDLQNPDVIKALVHLNPVLALDFSSDNRLLLTSALEDSIYAWDLETRQIVRQFFAGTGPSDFVDFVEDDAFVLYTTLEDGIIHRHPLALEGLLESVCGTVQRDLTLEQRRTYGLDDSATCPVVVGR